MGASGLGGAKKMRLLPLVAATYFMVSGGPYGLEDIIGMAGYGRALLLLALVPLVWSLPTSLMVGELASAVPEEGGFYRWVRRAMGPFWGFQEAWLSLAASVFDMAIYPTTFVLYLSHVAPGLTAGHRGLALKLGIVGDLGGVESAWGGIGGTGVGEDDGGVAVAVCGADWAGGVAMGCGMGWRSRQVGAPVGMDLGRRGFGGDVELHGLGQRFDDRAGGGRAAEELSAGDADVDAYGDVRVYAAAGSSVDGRDSSRAIFDGCMGGCGDAAGRLGAGADGGAGRVAGWVRDVQCADTVANAAAVCDGGRWTAAEDSGEAMGERRAVGERTGVQRGMGAGAGIYV